MTTESTERTENVEIDSYSEMFREYEAGQTWIGPADLPLVFHVRQLCRQLDTRTRAGDEVKAAQWSSYLQAIERLERRRPKPAGPLGDGLRPDGEQPSIFDELPD